MMKVIEKNSWETRTYHVGDRKLTPGTDDRVDVRYPDGTEDVHTILWRKETHSYSDHGHRSSVTSHVPYVTLELHGVEVEVKLSDLDAEIL